MSAQNAPTDHRAVKKEKKAAKVVNSSVIYIGVGIGFFILNMIVPEIGNVEKMNAMKGLFSLTATAFILYGIMMLGLYKIVGQNIIAINTFMVWMVIPSYAIWFAYEAYKVLGG